MVFQNYALFPHLTVGQNLSFPSEVRKVEPARRREQVDRALRLVRLRGFEDRRPSQLSRRPAAAGGDRRALVFEPDLVLMDEPLGALDRRLREEMQYEIRRIQRTLGVTFVYVTHDQQEAMVLSDRGGGVPRGPECSRSPPPKSSYEEPMRSFVARFIGENNRIRGTIEALDGGLCAVRVGESLVRALRVASGGCRRADHALHPAGTGETRSPRRNVRQRVRGRGPGPDFLGDHLRVTVGVFGQDDFIVKIPNIVGHGGVLPGDRVRIGWTPTDCRALDHEDESEGT